MPMSRNGEPVYSCFFQQSSFANFAIAPAKDVVKIRRDAPIEMLGPLGCGLQTGAGAVLNVMQPVAGQSIAVYGVGGVGLAGLMAARIAGCDPIIAVDLLPSRLALARELGATHTLESRGAETLAPVGPQGPPTRAAPPDSWRSLHGARGSLLWTTGTSCACANPSTMSPKTCPLSPGPLHNAGEGAERHRGERVRVTRYRFLTSPRSRSCPSPI